MIIVWVYAGEAIHVTPPVEFDSVARCEAAARKINTDKAKQLSEQGFRAHAVGVITSCVVAG